MPTNFGALEFTVHSAQCTVCSVQCAVHSVQCAVCSVQFTYPPTHRPTDPPTHRPTNYPDVEGLSDPDDDDDLNYIADLMDDTQTKSFDMKDK